MSNDFNNIDQNLCPLDNKFDECLLRCGEVEEMDVVKTAKDLFFNDGKIDIIKLAITLGIQVSNTDEIDIPAKIYYIKENNVFKIFINIREKKTRQRFSIAHEIAHYLLHKDEIIRNGVVGREGDCSLSPREEREADVLAAKILMPDECVNDFLKKLNINNETIIDIPQIESLASAFDVSFYAAISKFRDLGFYVRYI